MTILRISVLSLCLLFSLPPVLAEKGYTGLKIDDHGSVMLKISDCLLNGEYVQSFFIYQIQQLERDTIGRPGAGFPFL